MQITALARHPLAVGTVVAVVLAGAGTAGANGWVDVFESERVAPVRFTTAELVALPDLGDYGDLVVARDLEVRAVDDATTAAAITGLPVPALAELPAGIAAAPIFHVADELTATFTLDADDAGELDGAQVQLSAGPGVAVTWPGSATDMPALFVGHAIAPTVTSSGGEFEQIRDYLLSRPGVPVALADQLASFGNDGRTLPLPVPADLATSSEVDVHGLSATLLTTRDRTISAITWVEAGIVTVIAGSLDADELLAVAGTLR